MNDLKGIIEDCNKSDLISDKIIKKIIEIIGQEEWQDLHDENNDICTTMGELIITLNGVADLEQKNAELEEQNTNLQIMLKAEREVRCNEDYLKRVTELEAQIEKMKLCANCKHCGVSGWCDKLNRYLLDKANQNCGNWEIKEK